MNKLELKNGTTIIHGTNQITYSSLSLFKLLEFEKTKNMFKRNIWFSKICPICAPTRNILFGYVGQI